MNTACLNNLVGIKGQCDNGVEPLFYLDDIEGMTQARLAKLAMPRDGSGMELFQFMNESAIRLILADIDSIIPTNYRVKGELVNVCSTCSFSGFYNSTSANGTGIVVKNMSGSRFTSLIIDSLRVKTNTGGNFTIRIIDSNGVTKDITAITFVAGEELTIMNVGFQTSAKQVMIYFNNPAVEVFTITCPTGSGCGCGGSSNTSTISNDIVINGFTGGIENSTQYGILPCVKIRCSYDDIICDLIHSSPRLFGVALLYLVASKAFEENAGTVRVNREASFDQESKKTDSEKYYSLYRERLIGNPKKSVLGISQAVNQNLKTIKDKCVTCDNPMGIAWAT